MYLFKKLRKELQFSTCSILFSLWFFPRRWRSAKIASTTYFLMLSLINFVTRPNFQTDLFLYCSSSEGSLAKLSTLFILFWCWIDGKDADDGDNGGPPFAIDGETFVTDELFSNLPFWTVPFVWISRYNFCTCFSTGTTIAIK